MMVARQERRKTKITATTRMTVSISSNCTSSTDARTVVVRSVSDCTSIEAGRLACSCGRSPRIESTTRIVFALDCRWIFTITAGVSPDHAASCAFSTPLLTWAISFISTALPLR